MMWSNLLEKIEKNKSDLQLKLINLDKVMNNNFLFSLVIIILN